MRVMASILLYFAIVFVVGFLLGPVRILVLEPLVGPTLAVACEAPILVAVMIASSRWLPRAAGHATENTGPGRDGRWCAGVAADGRFGRRHLLASYDSKSNPRQFRNAGRRDLRADFGAFAAPGTI